MIEPQRMDRSRLLTVAILLDAMFLLPAVFVIAVFTDHVAFICF